MEGKSSYLDGYWEGYTHGRTFPKETIIAVQKEFAQVNSRNELDEVINKLVSSPDPIKRVVVDTVKTVLEKQKEFKK